MDSPSLSNQLDIFQIYRRYCEITVEVYASEGDGYRHGNESMKAKLAREALSHLLDVVESKVQKHYCYSSLRVSVDGKLVDVDEHCVINHCRMSIFEELSILMSRLNLMVDSHEFLRFYNFVFFICRENGQRSIKVKHMLAADHICRLLQQKWWTKHLNSNNQRHNVSEDTWRQVLAFSRCVHENLEGYDPEGAWPVLIDEFVEHMYRMSGSEDTHKLGCKCGDSEAQSIYEALHGLKVYPGTKRKLDGQELESMDDIIS